jgi:hypothetical protein
MDQPRDTSLELVPIEDKAPESREAISAATNTSLELTGNELLILLLSVVVAILVTAGAVTTFDWLSGSNLKQVIANEPLKAATYAFLTIISMFAGIEVRRILLREPNIMIKRSYWLALMVACMISYALFYSHITLNLHPPEHPLVVGSCAAAGVALGWWLPTLTDDEPYGTLAYLMALVFLIGFTWLARLESIATYGWAAFATMISFFFRSAMDGLQKAQRARLAQTSNGVAP